MKPAYMILLAASLSLIACTSMDAMEINTWIAQNKPRAGTSELYWSDYYKEIYRMAAQAEGMPGRQAIMESANAMYKAALTYEAKRLDGKEFNSMRRIADGRIAEAESSTTSGETTSGASWGKGDTVYVPAPSLKDVRSGK